MSSAPRSVRRVMPSRRGPVRRTDGRLELGAAGGAAAVERYRSRDVYGRVLGVAVVGVLGHVLTVEAHIGRGLPSLTLTGLPGASVQDSRDRIRPAVESSGLEWPLRRVIVNLSPSDLRKEGP